MKRIDPLTGEEFIAKKISQKFASSNNRIMFNNQKAIKLRQERSFIDKHLNKNHRILREIYVPGNENIFNSFWLEGKGYRFDVANHFAIYKGVYVPAIFEFTLIDTKTDNLIKIMKNGGF